MSSSSSALETIGLDRACWPRSAAHVRGPVERLGDLRAPILGAILHDVRAVAALDGQPVELISPEPGALAETTSAELAEAAFRAGRGAVRLRLLHRTLPAAARWLRALLADLDVPVARASVNAYLSRAGSAGVAHYDGHEVIMVQLHGRKRWRHAPSGVDAPESGRELDSNGDMPADCQVVILEPGDALFLPRGTLHLCDTLADSLHVTFALTTAIERGAYRTAAAMTLDGDRLQVGGAILAAAERHRPLLAWLCDRGSPFSLADATRAAGVLGAGEVRRLLGALHDLGGLAVTAG